MSRLLSFQTLGTAREAPRLWIEGRRLELLGFTPGIPIDVEIRPLGLIIKPAALGEHHVSRRRRGDGAGSLRPIVDINSRRLLGHLAGAAEMRVTGSAGRLEVSPSVRAFNIMRSRGHVGPFRVLDVFCGGGTQSDGFAGNSDFQVVAGVEIEPDYADEFGAKHPAADVILGDFRRMCPEEFPEFDVLAAGIPCSDHSAYGKAKKHLGGCPELGDVGDLYVPVLALVASRMPAAVTLENVEAYGRSLAGRTIVSHLRKLGYHVQEEIIRPNTEWNEPTSRNRWLAVATLAPGFSLSVPNVRFRGKISDYLDEPDFMRDQADAERIAKSIVSLHRNCARQARTDHGFPMQVLRGGESVAPTVTKSYHKVNTGGFFVETAFGPRLLRRDEIARLHGQVIRCEHYATAVQMMGQGVLTRVFQEIFRQLGGFLAGSREPRVD